MKQYLNTSDICREIGISRMTAWRMKRQGRWIAQPPTMFHTIPMWSLGEYEAWKKGLKLATRPQPAGKGAKTTH